MRQFNLIKKAKVFKSGISSGTGTCHLHAHITFKYAHKKIKKLKLKEKIILNQKWKVNKISKKKKKMDKKKIWNSFEIFSCWHLAVCRLQTHSFWKPAGKSNAYYEFIKPTTAILMGNSSLLFFVFYPFDQQRCIQHSSHIYIKKKRPYKHIQTEMGHPSEPFAKC